MVRVVHTAISCFDSILDEAQSPDQSGNNVSNLNELVFYHLIWWVVLENSNVAKLASTQYLAVHALP